jgi:hypothetical protein
MATLQDVLEIASRLPGATESEDWFGFSVMFKGKPKGFIWTWGERVQPKKPKVRNPGVLVALVRNLTEKEMLLGSDPEKFFTEPHYNGFPAVHIRLEAIEPDELEDLIIEAWRTKATPDLLKAFENASS